MSTVQTRMPAEEMVHDALRAGGKVFSGIDWEAYEAFLDELDGQRVRHIYLDGKLEIMPTHRPHENWLESIGDFLLIWFEETQTEFEHGGAMTLKSDKVRRGVEGDRCYWIANADKIRGVEKLDLKKHPPPDLYIEMEVSRTVLSRLKVLAGLKVPEVWRFSAKTLKVGLLQPDGTYAWGEKSPAFPSLPVAEFAKFLRQSYGKSRLAALREFRAWTREKAE